MDMVMMSKRELMFWHGYWRSLTKSHFDRDPN